ncbi:hypothetical protein PFWH6_0296 [Pseudomonas fluorescens WH6]|nr:hypothetical protein PFWH6_0296 [Pseudomonas fluorescens WH6]
MHPEGLGEDSALMVMLCICARYLLPNVSALNVLRDVFSASLEADTCRF